MRLASTPCVCGKACLGLRVCGTVEDVVNHLGDVVRELREDAGLTLSQLARHAGVDLSSLSRLERHIHHTMTLDNMAKVAQALGTSVDELERRTGGDGDDSEVRRRWPTLDEWLARDRNLTEQQRSIIRAVYEGFVRPR